MPPLLLRLLQRPQAVTPPPPQGRIKTSRLANGGTFALLCVFVNKSAGMAFRCGGNKLRTFPSCSREEEAQSLAYRTCGTLITEAKIGFAGSS